MRRGGVGHAHSQPCGSCGAGAERRQTRAQRSDLLYQAGGLAAHRASRSGIRQAIHAGGKLRIYPFLDHCPQHGGRRPVRRNLLCGIRLPHGFSAAPGLSGKTAAVAQGSLLRPEGSSLYHPYLGALGAHHGRENQDRVLHGRRKSVRFARGQYLRADAANRKGPFDSPAQQFCGRASGCIHLLQHSGHARLLSGSARSHGLPQGAYQGTVPARRMAQPV